MTTHAAASFFESDGSFGYVLGSDSLANVWFEEDGDGRESAMVSKAFRGETFLGVCSASIKVGIENGRGLEANLNAYNDVIASLNGAFEGIEDGKDYSSLPALESMEGYRFFVAKAGAQEVALYSIMNHREKSRQVLQQVTQTESEDRRLYEDHQAKLLDRIDREVSNGTAASTVLVGNGFIVTELTSGERWSLERSVQVVEGVIDSVAKMDPGTGGAVQLYVVSTNGIEDYSLNLIP